MAAHKRAVTPNNEFIAALTAGRIAEKPESRERHKKGLFDRR
jgi:hypothetical protein